MKSLAAFAAAGIVGISAFAATPVFAADDIIDGSTADVTKTLTLTDGVKPASAVKFSFNVAPSGTVDAAAGLDKDTVFKGVPNGLTVEDTNTTSTAVQNENTLTYTTQLVAHASAFDLPGIYQYTVNETPNNAAEYEGISFDKAAYTVKVYVTYNDAGTALQVNNLVVTSAAGKTKDVVFANTYDPSTLTVTKLLAGNQAVATDKFPFTLTIKGTAGEEYKYAIKNGETTSEPVTLTANAEGTATQTGIEMGKNTQLIVYGLSENDTYTLTETDLKGYESSWTDATTTSAMGAADKSISVTNTKSGAVPTGIIMSAAPYAAIVGLGGVFAGLFFRKKKED